MGKDIKTERYLSEEEMQAAIGGCPGCKMNLTLINFAQGKVELNRALANISHHLELPDLARQYSDRADDNLQTINRARKRFEQLQKTPGHSPPPSPDMPPNKRQRLQ